MARRQRSKADTWLPLYVGDYLADTMHLDATGHGAYLLLLMHSWRRGALPDDDAELAAIARVTPEVWAAGLGRRIRGFFLAVPEGLVQPRLEQERAIAANNTAQRQAAGKASAEARARQREGNARSTAVAAPLPQEASEEAPAAPPAGKRRATAVAAPLARKGAGKGDSAAPRPLRGASEGAEGAESERRGSVRSTSVAPPLEQNARPSPSPSPRESSSDSVVVSLPTRARGRATGPFGPDGPMGDELPERWISSRTRKRPWWGELAWLDDEGTWRVGLRQMPEGAHWELCWNAPIDLAEHKVLDAAGLGIISWEGSTEPLMRWLARGLDLHLAILPAIEAAAAKPGYRPPSSLKYFERWVEVEAAAVERRYRRPEILSGGAKNTKSC